MGTRSRQCQPKVPGSFAFPGACNPRICSGKFFQQFSRDFLGVFLGNARTDPGNSHSLLQEPKKGVLAKGVFAEIRRFSSHCCSCTVCTATWHPMCPLATSPYLSALLVCLSSICSKGCHVSWRQERYRTTCKLAEPKYSTAFDKNEETHLCRNRVCLCSVHCMGVVALRRAACGAQLQRTRRKVWLLF